MKKISILMLLAVLFAFVGQKPVFKVEYSGPSKTVVVSGTELVLTEYVETYDNPMSSIPSGRTQQMKKATLTAPQVQALKTKLDQSGFWKLTKVNYGAAENERGYPYTIKATNGKKIKTVVYSSNPAPETEKMPKAFEEVESHINKLVASITTWK